MRNVTLNLDDDNAFGLTPVRGLGPRELLAFAGIVALVITMGFGMYRLSEPALVERLGGETMLASTAAGLLGVCLASAVVAVSASCILAVLLLRYRLTNEVSQWFDGDASLATFDLGISAAELDAMGLRVSYVVFHGRNKPYPHVVGKDRLQLACEEPPTNRFRVVYVGRATWGSRFVEWLFVVLAWVGGLSFFVLTPIWVRSQFW